MINFLKKMVELPWASVVPFRILSPDVLIFMTFGGFSVVKSKTLKLRLSGRQTFSPILFTICSIREKDLSL